MSYDTSGVTGGSGFKLGKKAEKASYIDVSIVQPPHAVSISLSYFDPNYIHHTNRKTSSSLCCRLQPLRVAPPCKSSPKTSRKHSS